MRIELTQTKCTVYKEKGDPVFSGVKNAAGESRLLYHMKPILEKITGKKFIKKRMWKDGHLVDEMQQYVRTEDKENYIMIYNGSWQIEGADTILKREGKVSFIVVANIDI